MSTDKAPSLYEEFSELDEAIDHIRADKRTDFSSRVKAFNEALERMNELTPAVFDRAVSDLEKAVFSSDNRVEDCIQPLTQLAHIYINGETLEIPSKDAKKIILSTFHAFQGFEKQKLAEELRSRLSDHKNTIGWLLMQFDQQKEYGFLDNEANPDIEKIGLLLRQGNKYQIEEIIEEAFPEDKFELQLKYVSEYDRIDYKQEQKLSDFIDQITDRTQHAKAAASLLTLLDNGDFRERHSSMHEKAMNILRAYKRDGFNIEDVIEDAKILEDVQERLNAESPAARYLNNLEAGM